MLLIFPFCAKDKPIAKRLADWISELGGVSNHDCLMAVHIDTNSDGVREVLEGCFKRVAEFSVDDLDTSYPLVANNMWKRSAQHVADMNESMPWFWIEPDAVPLVPEWLDRIEAEYLEKKKPFLLDQVITPSSVHNSGIGVYPAKVRNYTTKLWALEHIPWDVFFKEDFTPNTHHTALIHDKFYEEWGKLDSGPPVFPDAESLKKIEPDAVIFHRNKDGSLIKLLRGGESLPSPVVQIDSVSAPIPATAGTLAITSLLARIEALEAAVFPAQRNGVVASASEQSEDRGLCVPPSLKPPRQPRQSSKAKIKPKRQYTPEQLTALRERMANARAARKAA